MDIQKMSKPPPIHRVIEILEDKGVIITACGVWVKGDTYKKTVEEVTCKSCLEYMSGSLTLQETDKLKRKHDIPLSRLVKMTKGTTELAKKVRIHVLKMANSAGTSHVGSCLSCADILAVLYGGIMRYKPDDPDWDGRDRFILSKGHTGSALYATLAECKFFPVEELDTHCQSGSLLLGHVSHLVPGVEASTGSLGHGLSIGCGMAMATRSRVFVLLSDGDLNEGATWEAIMFAGQHKLHNLTAIVDWNRMQAMGKSKGIVKMQSVSRKVAEFGWRARDIGGHNHSLIRSALTDTPKWDRRPSFVVAHTVKGKGVSQMENRVEWHYKSPSDEELEKALRELG